MYGTPERRDERKYMNELEAPNPQSELEDSSRHS
jgi:hypothetical protein